MADNKQLLLFKIKDLSLAFPIEIVSKIIQSQEVSPADDPTGLLKGVFNFHGVTTPLISLRNRFGLPPADINVDNLFIIIKRGDNNIAVIADEVIGLVTVDFSSDVKSAQEITSGISRVDFMTGNDSICFIYNSDTLLTNAESVQINSFLSDVK